MHIYYSTQVTVLTFRPVKNSGVAGEIAGPTADAPVCRALQVRSLGQRRVDIAEA